MLKRLSASISRSLPSLLMAGLVALGLIPQSASAQDEGAIIDTPVPVQLNPAYVNPGQAITGVGRRLRGAQPDPFELSHYGPAPASVSANERSSLSFQRSRAPGGGRRDWIRTVGIKDYAYVQNDGYIDAPSDPGTPRLNAQARLIGGILGNNKVLGSVEHVLWASATDGSVEVKLRMLGQDVGLDSSRGHTAKVGSLKAPRLELSSILPLEVLGVPLSVEAGLRSNYKVDYTHVTTPGRVSFTSQPSVNSNVFGKVTVGFGWVASASLTAAGTLASVNWQLSGSHQVAGSLGTVSRKASTQFSALDCRIKVDVTFVGLRGSKTILETSPIRRSATFFDETLNYRL